MTIVSHIHEIYTVYNVFQTTQMVLLSEKGAHNVCARYDQVIIILMFNGNNCKTELVHTSTLD